MEKGNRETRKQPSGFEGRRALLRQSLLTAGAALAYSLGIIPSRAASTFPAAKRGPGKRPDIVIFIADDLSWTDIEPNGSPDVRTPHLNQLAKDGLRFTRAFCASPTCTPSRSAILTGDYPMRNGAHANHSNIRDTIRTMPAYLKALGYRVVLAGKTDIGPRSDFPFEYLEGSTVRPAQKKNVLLSHLDTRAVERLLATRDPETPLAIFIASYQPHVPWAKNAGYDPAKLALPANFVDTPETREARARYFTDVADLDREIGDVRASIARHGKADDTLFFFTADHGAQFPFAKWNLYDPGIHIPLIASWPSHCPAGESTDAMISLIDLLPTVLEAAGGSAPAAIDGRSFMPVLTGRQQHFHDAIFAAHTGDRNFNRSPMRAIRTGRWKLIVNLNPSEIYINALTESKGERGLWDSWVAKAQTDTHAAELVRRYQHRSSVELYDLSADPGEMQNLAGKPECAAIQKQLQDQLDRWRVEQGERLTDVPLPEDAHFGEHTYNGWQ